MKVLLTTLNAKYIHSSLALRNLKMYCQHVVDKIDIKEYTINNSLLDILADIYKQNAHIIGFACYIWNIEMTLKLASMVKKVLPDIKVILGGPEVSYDPGNIIRTCDYVDYIVVGEGEETLKRLLQALSSGVGDISSIAGLAYRGQNFTDIELYPQIIKNLDDIPFAYTEQDIKDLSDKIIYYESSRGCPFSCQYCLSSTTAGVRYYSLERVFSDLQYFVDHNVRQVKFVDRTFNANKAHYLPILNFLANQKCRTNFHFEIAADILDDDVLEMLAGVPKGRFQFEVGVQSTYEPTLKEIRRNNDWPKIVHAVSRVVSYGNIHMHLDLIVGLPYEDINNFGKSFNDVFSLTPDMIQIGFLKLLKGSGIRNRGKQHGYIYMDTPPYEVLANKYMSYNDVCELKMLEELFEHLYNSGRCKLTINYLISVKFAGNAFAMFRSLTAYWEAQSLHMKAHSSKSLIKYFKEFCVTILDDNQLKCCVESLKFDVLLSDKGNSRPDFLSWSNNQYNDEITAFWRNESKVSKYLPGYKFTTWREIKKNYHIEVFETEIFQFLNLDIKIDGKCILLFDYTGDVPRYQQISNDDFWLKEA